MLYDLVKRRRLTQIDVEAVGVNIIFGIVAEEVE